MDRQNRQDPDYRESRADAAAQQEQRAQQAQKVAREHHETQDGDRTALPQGPEVPRAREQGDEQLSANQKEACARVLDGTQEQSEKAEAKARETGYQAAEKHLGGEIHPSDERAKNPAHKTEKDAHPRC